MADEPAASTTTWSDIHPKVAVAAIASLIAAILLPWAKQHGVDLGGQEGNIQALIAIAAGYLTPGGAS
jgi:hypothetical protein